MKKITLIILAVFTVGIINAQRTVETETMVAPFGIVNFDQSKANDTIFPPSALMPCFDTLTYYQAGAAGYVTGNNQYGDTEKAQKFLGIPTNTTVISALAYVIAKSTTGSSTLKIYSVNATTGEPQTELGQSASIANSAIAAGLTVYNFATPVDVAGEFFASVVLPTGATDTLVVVSTKDKCFQVDELSWERWDTGAWHTIKSQWGAGGNPLQVDLVIFPVINTTVGMTEITQDNLISIFPNPSNDIVNIASMNTIEVINIYNALGQIVRSYNVQDNFYVVNVSDLQKGFYYMQVQTVQGMVSKTVLVN